MNETLTFVDRMFKETYVFVEEDYGYGYWVWFPGMSSTDLDTWWRSLQTVSSFAMSPNFLPGSVFSVSRDQWYELKAKFNRSYMAMIDNDVDSFLERPDGIRLSHAGRRVEF